MATKKNALKFMAIGIYIGKYRKLWNKAQNRLEEG